MEELYELVSNKIDIKLADIDFIRPSIEYAKEIGDYRQEFLANHPMRQVKRLSLVAVEG